MYEQARNEYDSAIEHLHKMQVAKRDLYITWKGDRSAEARRERSLINALVADAIREVDRVTDRLNAAQIASEQEAN